MLYILHGPDDYSITRELDAVKLTGGDPSLLATNTIVLDGTLATIDELRVACETVPFLSDRRLVVVYGLLERFAPRTARPLATKKNEPAAYDTFAALINNIPPSTTLVLIDSEVKDTNPLLRLVIRHAKVKAFPPLKTPELREWITARVREESGDISPSAVNSLARLIGGNLWIMSSELRKLLLYADGRRIEETDVKTIVSYTQQVNVFNMVDAIVEFNMQKAESTVQQLLKEGESPIGLLAMLNRQMRLIVRARELKKQGLSENEIRGRLRIASEFLVRKVLEQSARYTLPRLRQVYQQLLETDIAIKTGKYDAELALNILVAELCQPQKSAVIQPRLQGVTK